MNQSGTDSGQSMEDILASIRRIIAEGEQDAKGGPGAAPAPVSEAAKPSLKADVAKAEAPKVEVFELTQIVQDDGSIVNVGDVVPKPEPAAAEVKADPARTGAEPVAQASPPAASEAPVVVSPPPDRPAAPPAEQPAIPAPAIVAQPAPAAQPEVPPADAKVESAMAALSRMMDLTQAPAPDALAEDPPERSGSSLTVDELVREAVRPLLRQWLDTNLPPLVERLVREAVDRVAKRAG